jgi:integrase/recombinase XerC
MPTIKEAFDQYITVITTARSLNTSRSYRNALNYFGVVLVDHKIDISCFPVENLSDDSISWLISDLKNYTTSTENLYLTAVKNFFEFLLSEGLSQPNLTKIKLLIRQRSRKPNPRLPQFPRSDIEKVLDYAINLSLMKFSDANELLQNLRDRAFLVSLADTGMRVHEACNLIRGDVDWFEGKAVIIGKGGRQAVVRFSIRSIAAIKDYLNQRSTLDGASGRPLSSLPVFARHDRGSGKRIKKITTTTGRNIVTQRVIEALGPDKKGVITPHSFRHYFVTTVLRSSGNLKLAQELARHKNISVTQRYAHLSDDELDQGYWSIFDK